MSAVRKGERNEKNVYEKKSLSNVVDVFHAYWTCGLWK